MSNPTHAVSQMMLQILVSLGILGGAQASAASIKFCFTTEGDFMDNGLALPGGTTEDFWIIDAPRRLRGARTIVKIGTTTYFDGVLGDSIGVGDPGVGCTTTMTVPNANSTYQFQLYSSGGEIDNRDGNQHTLNIKMDEDDDTVHDVNLITVVEHSAGEGTFEVDMSVDMNEDVSNVWRLQATAAYTLARVGRWADPAVVDVFVDMHTDAVSHYEDGNVFINAGNAELPLSISRKYIIAHEIGHLLADQYAFAVGGDCDLSEAQCDSPTHAMGSKEYQTCAFTEGIANFFSVATWNEFNSSSETDCVYGYQDFNGIDCDGSLSVQWPEAFMETVCTNSSHTDRGVEVDWLRQFWDVKTGGSVVDFDDMMGWVYVAYLLDGFGFDDPYYELSAAAVSVGGTIQSKWESADDVNGIDW